MKITSARVRKPFQVSFEEISLRPPGAGDVLLDVLACGICGYDIEIAHYLADDPQAFGHEVVGIVREVGDGVTHVSPGDQVVLESSSFCCDCLDCRNGRVDLCAKGRNFWSEQALGFSESMVAPARGVVLAPDMDPMAAVLAEPCGVAIDMVKTADIELTDRVLVVGTGAIGLMALAVVRHRTTGLLAAANRTPGRLEWAKRFGADAVISLAEASLAACGEPYGGFDKILVTAPPQVIPDCITAAAYGGYIVFIGSDFAGGGVVPIDTHALHFGKKQLRSSFASPALYLPEALHLLRVGVVPAKDIVSHVFPLTKLGEALRTIRENKDTARKVVVVPDAHFKDMEKN